MTPKTFRKLHYYFYILMTLLYFAFSLFNFTMYIKLDNGWFLFGGIFWALACIIKVYGFTSENVPYLNDK